MKPEIKEIKKTLRRLGVREELYELLLEHQETGLIKLIERCVMLEAENARLRQLLKQNKR